MSRTDFFLGTKTTAKDMVKLCDDFNQLIKNSQGPILQKDYEYSNEVSNKLLEIIDKLTQFAYEEGRIEEVIKKIIERSKQDLINLIKEDEAFTKDETKATQILQELRKNADLLKSILGQRRGIKHANIHPSWEKIAELNRLLVKDADISEAVQVIARDLEKLMRTLRETEK